MSLLKILKFPDPFLKTKAAPVKVFDAKLKKFAEDMIETMYEEQGIGLASIQVGVDCQLIVVDVEQTEDDENRNRNPFVIINPVIISAKGESNCEEGCLSVPEIRADVPRFEKISIEYRSLDNTVKTLEAEGLLAICIQHEMDHLKGILFIDYLPPLKQKMVKKRLSKIAKQSE